MLTKEEAEQSEENEPLFSEEECFKLIDGIAIGDCETLTTTAKHSHGELSSERWSQRSLVVRRNSNVYLLFLRSIQSYRFPRMLNVYSEGEVQV